MISVIFLYPINKALTEFKSHLEEDGGIEVLEVDSLSEFIQTISTIGPSIVLTSDTKKCARFLAEHKDLVNSLHSKISIVSGQELPAKTVNKLMELGLTDFISGEPHKKALELKLNLWKAGIAKALEEKEEKEHPHEKDDIVTFKTSSETSQKLSTERQRVEKLISEEPVHKELIPKESKKIELDIISTPPEERKHKKAVLLNIENESKTKNKKANSAFDKLMEPQANLEKKQKISLDIDNKPFSKVASSLSPLLIEGNELKKRKHHLTELELQERDNKNKHHKDAFDFTAQTVVSNKEKELEMAPEGSALKKRKSNESILELEQKVVSAKPILEVEDTTPPKEKNDLALETQEVTSSKEKDEGEKVLEQVKTIKEKSSNTEVEKKKITNKQSVDLELESKKKKKAELEVLNYAELKKKKTSQEEDLKKELKNKKTELELEQQHKAKNKISVVNTEEATHSEKDLELEHSAEKKKTDLEVYSDKQDKIAKEQEASLVQEAKEVSAISEEELEKIKAQKLLPKIAPNCQGLDVLLKAAQQYQITQKHRDFFKHLHEMILHNFKGETCFFFEKELIYPTQAPASPPEETLLPQWLETAEQTKFIFPIFKEIDLLGYITCTFPPVKLPLIAQKRIEAILEISRGIFIAEKYHKEKRQKEIVKDAETPKSLLGSFLKKISSWWKK